VLCIYCFFPLFLPVEPETDAAAVIDYAPDDQPFAAEQQGKQNPLEHSDITYSLSLMLALDFATVFKQVPILMHSLFLNTAFIPAFIPCYSIGMDSIPL
jgi:hypothetical protein